MIQVLRLLLSFGVDRGYRDDNPALRIKPLRGSGEGHTPWEDDQIAAFLAADMPKVMTTGLLLGLHTGQRRADAIRMTWADFDGDVLRVVPQKTKRTTRVKLAIPCHPVLADHLASLTRRHMLILTTDIRGVPNTGAAFSHRFHDVVVAAGLEGLSFHGLRNTATRMLAKAGCTGRDIMAVTGHPTHPMVSRNRGKRSARGSVEAGDARAGAAGARTCKLTPREV